jgi:hypothetical protein
MGLVEPPGFDFPVRVLVTALDPAAAVKSPKSPTPVCNSSGKERAAEEMPKEALGACAVPRGLNV